MSGALVTGLVFRQPRSFCKAFCPSGALLSVYGRYNPVQLEARDPQGLRSLERIGDGSLSAPKVLLLGSAIALDGQSFFVLALAVAVGALTSHLPKGLRERTWWRSSPDPT